MSRATRQRRAATALAALEDQIVAHLAELASLERARDYLLRRAAGPEADRCDRWRDDNPCTGVVHARWCAECGLVFRRCAEHGGLLGATHAVDEHRSGCEGP